MTQRTVQRFVAVAALASILFLTATPVQARDLGPAPRVLQRLQDLWSKGVSAFWDWSGTAVLPPIHTQDLRKAGSGSDPNGSRTSGSTPSAGTNGDQGAGSDPNG